MPASEEYQTDTSRNRKESVNQAEGHRLGKQKQGRGWQGGPAQLMKPQWGPRSRVTAEAWVCHQWAFPRSGNRFRWKETQAGESGMMVTDRKLWGRARLAGEESMGEEVE